MFFQRNSLIVLVRLLLLSDNQIFLSDGGVPFSSSIAYLVLSSCMIVFSLCLFGISCLIPLYRVAWDIVCSLAPVRLKFSGRNRSRSTSSGRVAPSAASLSASSLPSSPLCPLTH